MSAPADRVGILDILRIREIRAALAGTFVIMLGFGILLPILPLYARSFGVSYGAVGVLVSAFSTTRLVFDLFAGRLVGRHGERRMAALGALVVGGSSVLAAMAPTFPLLVLFRGVGGAGSALFFAALLAYLLKAAPERLVGRVMGAYYGAFNLGFIAGPLIAHPLARGFGLASPLWVYGGACLVAAVVFHRSIVDLDSRESPAGDGKLRDLEWNRPFFAILVSALAMGWVLSAVSAMLPLFASDRLGRESLGAIGIAVWSVTEFAVLYPAGILTDRIGRKPVLAPSMVGLVVVLALFGTASTGPVFMAFLAVLGIFTGLGGVPPSVMLSDVAPPHRSPVATGVFRFSSDLGFVFGPLVAGVSADAFGLSAAFAFAAAPSAVAFLLLASIRDTRPVLRRGEREG